MSIYWHCSNSVKMLPILVELVKTVPIQSFTRLTSEAYEIRVVRRPLMLENHD